MEEKRKLKENPSRIAIYKDEKLQIQKWRVKFNVKKD